MANVDGKTLMMAVQAVRDKVDALDRERNAADPDDDDLADVEELLLSYTLAQDKLKRAYKEEQAKTTNLPPYAKLVP